MATFILVQSSSGAILSAASVELRCWLLNSSPTARKCFANTMLRRVCTDRAELSVTRPWDGRAVTASLSTTCPCFPQAPQTRLLSPPNWVPRDSCCPHHSRLRGPLVNSLPLSQQWCHPQRSGKAHVGPPQLAPESGLSRLQGWPAPSALGQQYHAASSPRCLPSSNFTFCSIQALLFVN